MHLQLCTFAELIDWSIYLVPLHSRKWKLCQHPWKFKRVCLREINTPSAIQSHSIGTMAQDSTIFSVFLVMFATPCQLQTTSPTYAYTSLNPLLGLRCDELEVRKWGTFFSAMVSYVIWEVQDPSRHGGVVPSWGGDRDVYALCKRCTSFTVPATRPKALNMYINMDKLGAPDTNTGNL